MPSASSNLAPSAIHSCLVQWQNGRMWTGRRRFDPSSRDQVRQAATPDMLRSSNWQRRRSQKPRAAGSNHPRGTKFTTMTVPGPDGTAGVLHTSIEQVRFLRGLPTRSRISMAERVADNR
jgi:hypothetical protein